MEFKRSLIAIVSAFVAVLPLFVHGQSLESKTDCRGLSAASCAFAVDSYGARCILETFSIETDVTEAIFACKTSNIMASKAEEYVETDACVTACGVDRMTVGISTDAFFIPGFAAKLCSVECQSTCSNIVDLYTNVVASTAPGAFLDRFCSDFHTTSGLRRQMRARKLINTPADGPTSLTGPADGPTSLTGPADGPASDFNRGHWGGLGSGPADAPSASADSPTNALNAYDILPLFP